MGIGQGKKLLAGRGGGGVGCSLPWTAALQVFPGGAGSAHIPRLGAGPPGVADAAAAAERGAVRPARAAPAPGGRPAPRPHRPAGLAAARRALPEPAAGGRAAGERAPGAWRRGRVASGRAFLPLPVPLPRRSWWGLPAFFLNKRSKTWLTLRCWLLFQTRQTKLDFHQEQAAEKMLKKASKGVCQLRGQNLKEPIQVQTFR